MTYTIQQIADALGAKAVGDTTLRIAKLAEPATAHADDLALAMSPKYAQTLSDGAALAAMLWPDADWQLNASLRRTLIITLHLSRSEVISSVINCKTCASCCAPVHSIGIGYQYSVN